MSSGADGGEMAAATSAGSSVWSWSKRLKALTRVAGTPPAMSMASSMEDSCVGESKLRIDFFFDKVLHDTPASDSRQNIPSDSNVFPQTCSAISAELKQIASERLH